MSTLNHGRAGRTFSLTSAYRSYLLLGSAQRSRDGQAVRDKCTVIIFPPQPRRSWWFPNLLNYLDMTPDFLNRIKQPADTHMYSRMGDGRIINYSTMTLAKAFKELATNPTACNFKVTSSEGFTRVRFNYQRKVREHTEYYRFDESYPDKYFREMAEKNGLNVSEL